MSRKLQELRLLLQDWEASRMNLEEREWDSVVQGLCTTQVINDLKSKKRDARVVGFPVQILFIMKEDGTMERMAATCKTYPKFETLQEVFDFFEDKPDPIFIYKITPSDEGFILRGIDNEHLLKQVPGAEII